VELHLTTHFDQNIRDARVWVFLMDADGKVVGEESRLLRDGKFESGKQKVESRN
jgi:hypothetical protein